VAREATGCGVRVERLRLQKEDVEEAAEEEEKEREDAAGMVLISTTNLITLPAPPFSCLLLRVPSVAASVCYAAC
jgi:hypothetical protein